MKHLELTISLAEASKKDIEIREALECMPLFQTYTDTWETIEVDNEDEDETTLLEDLASEIYEALTAVGVTEFRTRIIDDEK